ncbi:MAG: PAS domain S-box protein [Pseudomonadota bacterium]
MNRFPRWLVIASAIALPAVVCGWAWFYLDQQHLVRGQVIADLQAIARLKVNQLADWRSAQLRPAAVILESSFAGEAMVRWISDPDPDLAEKLLNCFRSMHEHFNYRDVMLVDRNGQVRLSLSKRHGPLHEDAAATLTVALRERRPAMTDLHAGPGDLPSHVDVVAPLIEGVGKAADPIGALVCRIDAADFLYPLIQFWPTPSRTAETLLVRRDGDAALFLNDVRHSPNTALKLRIPLSREDVPAVMAALGKEGVVQGADYRGVDVLSVLKPVPNSPWFMVAKIDADEALAGWRRRSLFIIALSVAILAFLVSAAGVVWQRNAKAAYRRLYESESALHGMEERYRITLASIGDGVVATDTEGRVEFINRVAATLTGLKLEEALGKPLAEVIRLIDEETRLPIEDPIRRLVEEGAVVGLPDHTALLAADGTERPIADSGAPIRDENRVIIGTVLVFRDQTEERAGQRRLHEARDRARQYLDVAGVIMLALNREGGVIMVNRKGCEILGYEESEILKRNWFDHFLPEAIRDPIRGIYKKIMDGERVIGEYAENPILTSDGEERIIAWHSSILRDRDGSIIGALYSGDDITRRRKAEEDLRKSEALLSKSQEIAHVGSWELDLTTNRLIWSDEVYRIFGMPPKEFDASYEAFLEAVHPDDRERVDAAYAKSIRDGNDTYEVEHRVVAKGSGEIRTVHEKCVHIRDSIGRITRSIGMVQDITDRKRMEDKLSESRNLMNLMMNSLPVAVFYVDADGIFRFNNRTHKQWCALGPEDIAGRDYHAVLGERQYAERVKQYVEAALSGQEANYETTLDYRDGCTRDIAVNYVPHFDGNGRRLGFIGLVRDITGSKEREKRQEELMREMRHFTYVVSHDLRAPLTNLGGFSNELEASVRDLGSALEGSAAFLPVQVQSKVKAAIEEDIPESLAFIKSSVTRMGNLINAILGLSRLGHAELRFEPLNMDGLVGQVLNSMAYQISEKRVLVSVARLPDIVGDRTAIEQIVGNLVDNALKYLNPAEPGEIKIIGWTRGNDKVFQIQDNGLGIDEQDLERVFQVFQRAGNRDIPGEGMGLAHVRTLVRRHGGMIWCESEPGVGSSFTFTIANLTAADLNEGSSRCL